MVTAKNISGGPLDVPALERMVDDGETVELPDTQADGVSPIVWPDNRWQKSGRKVAPEKASKAAEKADE